MLHYRVKSCWNSGITTGELGIQCGQGELEVSAGFGKGGKRDLIELKDFLLGSECFHPHPCNVPREKPQTWAGVIPTEFRAGGAALTCSSPGPGLWVCSWKGRNPRDQIPNPCDQIPNPRDQTPNQPQGAFPRAGHCRDFISERIPCLGLGAQGNSNGQRGMDLWH